MTNNEFIICVDDEISILNGLNQQLSRAFGQRFMFEFAQSGEEAIELLQELLSDDVKIPVLITDQMMPGMSGSELIAAIATISPETKCILLSGYTESEILQNLPKTNLLGCLPKPWEGGVLIDLIRSGTAI
jgi:YesN/AraC family two-component response regulator